MQNRAWSEAFAPGPLCFPTEECTEDAVTWMKRPRNTWPRVACVWYVFFLAAILLELSEAGKMTEQQRSMRGA
jgi:hypothetical protein